uniref:Geminin n=1 Tax=Schistocephalus solidus TaxID=70667 RepID=A0A0X3NXK9_SCHSO
MATETISRRGLSVRLDSHCKSIEKPFDPKSSIPEKTVDKERFATDKENENVNSTLKRHPNKLTIFKDSPTAVCRHCGHRKSKQDNPVVTTTSSSQTDRSGSPLCEWLCSDQPPVEYWMELAEQRRQALTETLEENKELCDLVVKLNEEIEKLSKIAEHAENFAKAIQDTKAINTDEQETQ